MFVEHAAWCYPELSVALNVEEIVLIKKNRSLFTTGMITTALVFPWSLDCEPRKLLKFINNENISKLISYFESTVIFVHFNRVEYKCQNDKKSSDNWRNNYSRSFYIIIGFVGNNLSLMNDVSCASRNSSGNGAGLVKNLKLHILLIVTIYLEYSNELRTLT